MEYELRCQELVERLKQIFDQGVIVGKDVFDFAESTFGALSLADMVSLLESAEGGADSELLYDLIFFPEEPVQLALEPYLRQACYVPEDEHRVAGLLAPQVAHIKLLSYNGAEEADVRVPRAAVTRFVTHLHIVKRIDPVLEQILQDPDLGDSADAIRVRLRNSRLNFSPSWIRFLACFIQKSVLKKSVNLQLLDFILMFLEEIGNEEDLYVALIKKKRFFFRNLQKANRFSEKLKKNNMETIMLSGVHAPCVNVPEMQAGIDAIDDICWTVYGQSEPLQSYWNVDALDLNCDMQEDRLNKMMRLLLG